MMIKMVDSDGDGQVSFTEFYNVVTDPDPAHTDFVKMAAQEEEDPDQTGDPGQMDAKAHERHKEITLRNKKREMMEAFTVLISVNLQVELQFVVCCCCSEVFLYGYGRVGRSGVVAEFGPLGWPRCRDSSHSTRSEERVASMARRARRRSLTPSTRCQPASPVDVPTGRERRRPRRSPALLLEVLTVTPRKEGGLQS